MKISTKVPSLMHDLYYVGEEPVFILLLILFYHNKIISREKLVSSIKSFNKGTLSRKVNTYHSNINDKWYNDEKMIDIYLHIYDGFKHKEDCFGEKMIKDVDFNDIIPTLLLFTGKGRNYSIDWFFHQVIKPVLERYKAACSGYNIEEYTITRTLNILKTFEINFSKGSLVTYDEWKGRGHSYGFCCEDCDGDFGEYMQRRYIYDFAEGNYKLLREEISKELNNKKTSAYWKNPNAIANNYIL